MLPQLLSNLPHILFFLAIAVYWIGIFIILYHLIRFGVGREPKIIAFLCFAGAVILLLLAMIAYFNLDVARFFN